MTGLVRVAFMRQREAEALPGHRHAALISITNDPGQPATLGRHWAAVLRLAFYDVEPAWAKPGQTLFTETQARALWRFVEALPGHVDTLCVHCRSGISRSGAVARAITELYGLAFDGEEKECNTHVLALLRAAAPATMTTGGAAEGAPPESPAEPCA